MGLKQHVVVDGGAEQLPDFLGLAGLAHGPHQLGDGGFQGHVVGFQQVVAVLHVLSHLVDGEVAASWGTWVAMMTGRSPGRMSLSRLFQGTRPGMPPMPLAFDD